MSEPVFFHHGRDFTIGEIVTLTGAVPRGCPALDRRLQNIAPADRAGPRDLTFLDNARFESGLGTMRAGACLTTKRFEARLPDGVTVLIVADAYRAFVAVAEAMFPEANRPSSLFERQGDFTGAFVHPSARVEDGVAVDPGAVIGPRAEIGAGTVVGAGATIGPDVRIGHDCSIGAGATVTHALIGDRVVLHPGCRIGQDGFGYVAGVKHRKVPQVGRVIIQDDVEIGANTTIDRGGIRDTVIGEGSKIDNQVQIAHNCSIGRHCLIAGQVGISGSVTVGDYAMLGGKVGLIDHLTIGEGAQLAAGTMPIEDVPPGEHWAGIPAQPLREWVRGYVTLRKLAARKRSAPDEDTDE